MCSCNSTCDLTFLIYKLGREGITGKVNLYTRPEEPYFGESTPVFLYQGHQFKTSIFFSGSDSELSQLREVYFRWLSDIDNENPSTCGERFDNGNPEEFCEARRMTMLAGITLRSKQEGHQKAYFCYTSNLPVLVSGRVYKFKKSENPDCGF